MREVVDVPRSPGLTMAGAVMVVHGVLAATTPWWGFDMAPGLVPLVFMIAAVLATIGALLLALRCERTLADAALWTRWYLGSVPVRSREESVRGAVRVTIGNEARLAGQHGAVTVHPVRIVGASGTVEAGAPCTFPEARRVAESVARQLRVPVRDDAVVEPVAPVAAGEPSGALPPVAGPMSPAVQDMTRRRGHEVSCIRVETIDGGRRLVLPRPRPSPMQRAGAWLSSVTTAAFLAFVLTGIGWPGDERTGAIGLGLIGACSLIPLSFVTAAWSATRVRTSLTLSRDGVAVERQRPWAGAEVRMLAREKLEELALQDAGDATVFSKATRLQLVLRTAREEISVGAGLPEAELLWLRSSVAEALLGRTESDERPRLGLTIAPPDRSPEQVTDLREP